MESGCLLFKFRFRIEFSDFLHLPVVRSLSGATKVAAGKSNSPEQLRKLAMLSREIEKFDTNKKFKKRTNMIRLGNNSSVYLSNDTKKHTCKFGVTISLRIEKHDVIIVLKDLLYIYSWNSGKCGI
jgi:hypothetical protein